MRGFTFIETLVTISILLILTSILVVYNRGGEKQIILTREKAKIIGLILKAKSQAINTLITSDPICGYGVHFEEKQYFLFQDRASNCAVSDHRYTQNDEQELLDIFKLPVTYRFSQLELADIFFMPPDPIVFLDGQRQTGERLIEISAADNDSRVNIKINGAGQISG
jgi:prepilin-type N-terminal cleavage/methylation domain-containing protein